MSRILVVAGGQLGSEGKGAVAGELARECHQKGEILVALRVGGPNAGHTVIGEDGREWRLQQIPVAAVTHPQAVLGIAAGSEVDLEVLSREVKALDDAGYAVSQRLVIDHQATLLEPGHAWAESGGRPHGEAGITQSIGSTGKGIGAARADRIWRSAKICGEIPALRERFSVRSTVEAARLWLEAPNAVLMIEGTQGFGLGLHAGFYPKCTSGDCTAIDFLAQAGISPWQPGVDLQIWLVYRTYPIRVAGNSGPLRNETTFQALGVPDEFTTVTKKVRRIGEWDAALAREAMLANGGPASRIHVVLTFLDYVFPKMAGKTSVDDEKVWSYLSGIDHDLGQSPEWLGTGPGVFVKLSEYAKREISDGTF